MQTAFTLGGTMNRLPYLWVALVLLWFSACTRTEQSAAPDDDQTQDLPPAGTWWGKERTWTDDAGKFSVTAELVEVRGDKVVLRRQDGKQITVPLAKLSDEDRKFVEKKESAERGAAVLLNVFPPPAVAPFDAGQAKAHQKAWADHLGVPVQITNSIGMKFNLIPPGEFAMGSPESESGRQDRETEHLVRITKPFYLGVYEVTQAQYERVMGDNPSYSKDANKPVEKVSWNDAIAFCRKLSEREGAEFRLPTEAEWEYACRAGTTTVFSSGDTSFHLDTTGWFADNSGKTVIDSTRIWKADRDNYDSRIVNNLCRPHAVGRKTPNAWGLYDMHGNVWEWCQDWHGPYDSLKVVIDPTGPTLDDWPSSGPLVPRRVLRGGAFGGPPMYVRAASRVNYPPVRRLHAFGFRLARTYPLSP